MLKQEMPDVREKITPMLLIVCAGLFLSVPCLLFGFPFYGDDSATHAVSYSRFAEQLWSGDLYPRWLPKMNGGLGSNYFFFYSPLPHYVTSIAKPFFPHDELGWTQLGIGACAALIASGLAFFLWGRNHALRPAAVMAATVYMALPYHLNIDLYTRGAYAELWAFACLPLVLHAIDCLKRDRSFALPWLSIAYTLLILTSLPTALIFSPVILFYGLVSFPRSLRWRKFGGLSLSLLLGGALSAIYLLPAIALKRFTFLSEGTSGHYFYGNWFLFTGLNWSSVRSDIFWFTLEVFVVALLAFVVARNPPNGNRPHIRFWLVITLISFWFMTALSAPVWSLLSVLQEVQFPWRFNAILSLATAALVAFALSHVRARSAMRVVFILVLMGMVGLWLYDLGQRAWVAYPVHYIDQSVVDERNRWLEQLRDQNEYRPRWVVSIREKDLDTLLHRIGKTPDVPGVASVDGAGTVSIQRWDRKAIVLAVNTTEPSRVNVSQFYFPGWAANLEDGAALDIKPSVPGGLVSISVPAVNQKVVLKRVYTLPELIGMVISGGAFLLCLILLANAFRSSAKAAITSAQVS